jgi:hypothetical protein
MVSGMVDDRDHADDDVDHHGEYDEETRMDVPDRNHHHHLVYLALAQFGDERQGAEVADALLVIFQY